MRKIIIELTVIVGIIFIALFTMIKFIPDSKYYNANKLVEAGDYAQAMHIYAGLEDYKDSEAKYRETNALRVESMLLSNKDTDPQTGDYCYFGSYEQNGNIDDGKEPVCWRVLDRDEDKVLIISYKLLDVVSYNDSRENVKWFSSDMREWLNSDFEDTAFTEKEQDAIVKTTVKTPKNSDYDTSGGRNTHDDIFLLSSKEADKYFEDDTDRQSEPTKYAKKNGIYLDEDNNSCWWWLRTPGRDNNMASNVSDTGKVRELGIYVDSEQVGVRPALWVNVSKLR